VSAELPGGWVRLHPLSPLAKGGRAVAFAFVVGGPPQLTHGTPPLPVLLMDLVIVALVVLGGVVSWLVTRWRVADGELQLETGLLRRESIRVPLVRVQAVDVVRPLVGRVLGISELRLVMAGSGNSKARLSFLPEQRAIEVRAELLAIGAGLAASTPEAPERPIASVPNGRLLASNLLNVQTIVIALFLTLTAVGGLLSSERMLPLLAAAIGGVFPLLHALVGRINAEFSFSISESPDGLRLHSGLLQTRHETIRPGRIQGVRLVEPLLWRAFGWCRLEVDVAQQRSQEAGAQSPGQLTRALLPVGRRDQVDELLQLVLPGAVLTAPAGSAVPTRAKRKAPLSYRWLATWHDDRFFAARTGRIQVKTVVVPFAKVQSIRLTQGPVQRRLDLVTLHVDTAGRHWSAAARDRDATEGHALLSSLPGHARAARTLASLG